MFEKKAGVLGSLGRLLGVLIIAAVVLGGCTSGGGGGSSSVSSADEDLQKIAEELKRLGEGNWEITTLERDGDVLNISMQVPDDPGKVTFREAQAADEAVHKILPRATGRIAWVSVQGIGLRTVLLEPVATMPEPEEEDDMGEHEGHGAGHEDM